MNLVYCPAPASADFLALFTESERWAAARAVVTGYQFFAQHILNEGEDTNGPEPGGYADTGIGGVGPNVWPAIKAVGAPAWLLNSGMKTRMEIGLVKPGAATAIDGTDNRWNARIAINRFALEGGRIAELAIDESLHAGLRLGCGLTLEQTAAYVAEGILELRPLVDAIYAIEPYPACSVAEIAAFWRALEQRGARPDGLILDVDFWAINNAGREAKRRWPADLIALGRACAPTPLSIINWGHAHRTDQEYCDEVLGGVQKLLVNGVIPQEIVIESWSEHTGSSTRDIPRNLGQHDSGSHTWLVRQIAAIVNG